MELYRLFHFAGMSMVLIALGGVLLHSMNGGDKKSNSFRKGMIITHGVGMLLILVAGFGMLARMGIHSLPLWVIVKLIIWLFFGALVAIAYKKPALGKVFWFAVPVLVLVAAYMGRTHLG